MPVSNFGFRIAFIQLRIDTEQIDMRVTVQNAENAVTLKIEGRVATPLISELHRAWQDVAPSLGARKLLVDLRGVTFMDTTGRRLLADIHARTGAEFIADRPLTKYYAEEAAQGI